MNDLICFDLNQLVMFPLLHRWGVHRGVATPLSYSDCNVWCFMRLGIICQRVGASCSEDGRDLERDISAVCGRVAVVLLCIHLFHVASTTRIRRPALP